MHVSCAPPIDRLLAQSRCHYTKFKLTVVDAVGDTTASLAINIADILLQARVRNAASAIGNRATVVLRLGCRKGEEREECDGESELHGDGGYIAVVENFKW